jgi:hypothetical protein
LEGTVVWEYDSMACPQTIIRLYRGMMKAYVNQTNTYEGSTVVVEHQDKDQAEGLELVESFILSGHQAPRTHIKTLLFSSTKTTGWRWPRDTSRTRKERTTLPDWSPACPSCRCVPQCR